MAKAQASTEKAAAKKTVVRKTVAKAAPKAKTVTKKDKNKPFAQAVGRRKSSVARVWLRKGKGEIIINGRSFEDYFTVSVSSVIGKESFKAFPKLTSGMTADINIFGGGFVSQAGAIRLGIARALVSFDETLKADCRKLGFLTVDSRVKERKKPGQKAARAKFQFTKR